VKKVLRKIWAGWKRFAHRLARVQTVILVTLFYFLVITPVGAVLSIFGWDPLAGRTSRRRKTTNWREVRDPEPDFDSMRRQS